MDVSTETVPAATDNERMSVHRVCRTCWPVVELGTPALCGAKVLGIKGSTKSTCADCLKASAGHRAFHFRVM